MPSTEWVFINISCFGGPEKWETCSRSCQEWVAETPRAIGRTEGMFSSSHAWEIQKLAGRVLPPQLAQGAGSQGEGRLIGGCASDQSLPAGAWRRCWWEESPKDSDVAGSPGRPFWALGFGTCQGEAPVPGSAYQNMRYCFISRVQRRLERKRQILFLMTKCPLVKYEKCFRNEFPALVWKQMLEGFFFFFFPPSLT